MSNMEEKMKEMDAAADVADKELKAMAQIISIPVARWFAEHYRKAGHKRLGRVLVQFAKETAKMNKSQMTEVHDDDDE
jgi:hypothetical protein